MSLSKQRENQIFKIGAIAKGIVYILIGGFAIATIIGEASGTNGPKAVVEWIGTNPFGKILLFLIGLGLLAYSSWRWYTAVSDSSDADTDAKGIAKRIGYACSGTAYGILSFTAFKLAFGSGGGGGNSKESAIEWLLAQSWGQVALGAIGLAILGTGIYQLYRAFTDDHMEDVNQSAMKSEEKETYRNLGRAGLTARAVIFGIIAYFLGKAALTSDPDKFKGMSDALSYLHDQSMGTVLLGVVGSGLLAHGIFMLVRARYEYQ